MYLGAGRAHKVSGKDAQGEERGAQPGAEWRDHLVGEALGGELAAEPRLRAEQRAEQRRRKHLLEQQHLDAAERGVLDEFGEALLAPVVAGAAEQPGAPRQRVQIVREDFERESLRESGLVRQLL